MTFLSKFVLSHFKNKEFSKPSFFSFVSPVLDWIVLPIHQLNPDGGEDDEMVAVAGHGDEKVQGQGEVHEAGRMF